MRARKSRLRLYGPILFLGVLLFAWRILWNAGADEMRTTLRRAADRLVELGVMMTYEPIEPRGFPFALRGISRDVAFAGPRRRASMEWLLVNVSLLHLDRIGLMTDRLEIVGDGELWTVDGDMRGSIGRDAVHSWMTRANAKNVVAQRGEDAWRIDALSFKASPDETDPRRISATLVVDQLALRDSPAKIDRIELKIGVEPARRAQARQNEPEREISLPGILVRFNDATLTGTGVIRVFAGGEVEGAVDACIDKPEELGKLAGDTGALSPADAAKAAAALAIAARLSKDGSLCAPIAMRDGEVSIAGVVIAKY